jgi:hypothetical protein
LVILLLSETFSQIHDPPASASLVLGLECTITPSLLLLFLSPSPSIQCSSSFPKANLSGFLFCETLIFCIARISLFYILGTHNPLSYSMLYFPQYSSFSLGCHCFYSRNIVTILGNYLSSVLLLINHKYCFQ